MTKATAERAGERRARRPITGEGAQRVERTDRIGHASNSFSLPQLQALEHACKSLLVSRGPVDAITRSVGFREAYAKVVRMRERAEVDGAQ